MSIKRLESLDPELPKAMYDIHAKYRDYFGVQLAAKRFVRFFTQGGDGQVGQVYIPYKPTGRCSYVNVKSVGP